MVTEEPITQNPTIPQRSPGPNNNGGENIFSPRFKSVAAMAGWDEETLLMASLIVDDTPDRENKIRKRPNFKTPPSNSRRKRREQSTKHPPIPATILNLDDVEEDTTRNRVSSSAKPILADNEREKKVEIQTGKQESETATSANGSINSEAGAAGAVAASIPCMDKLREELSCAICLDICFEPSTTPCGHSFCKKCLRSAADKCGKRCPKCRQLIGNGRSCTVNTVLWNTIQLLFPNEIEARKASSSSAEKQSDRDTSNRRHQEPLTRRPQPAAMARRRSSEVNNRDLGSTRSSSRRQAVPSQDEDAALALRLQREEFLHVVRVGRGSSSSSSSSSSNRDNSTISISLARENLRAMASRAINVRIRNRAT